MKTRLRLWPAALILGGYAALLVHAWFVLDTIRQYRMLRSLIGGLIAGLLLLLWAAFFSRLPGRVRLGVAGAAIGAVAVFVGLFRIRGVSGDLLPVIESRFAAEAPPALPPPAPPAPDAASPAASPAPGPNATPAPADAPGAPGRPATPPAEARGEPAPSATPTASSSPAWPQFLGPNRDAIVPDVRLARDWNARPPRLVWRQPIGAGWSSFAIVDGLAVTQEQREDKELVVAYDLATGKPRWSHADRTRYDTVIAGVGPRATPTVHEGRVFAQGATGILNALDLRTGRKLWSHQIVGENGAELPTWGKSGSPLVLEGRVIVSAGGKDGRSLVAYDASSGEPVWAGGTDTGSYSSPFLTRLGGRTQVVVFGGASVAGHDPTTGERLWEHPFPSEQPNVAQPLPLPGDRLLLSAGYGVGSKVIALSDGGAGAQQPSLVWETTRLKSKFANLIFHEGFVYGLDDGVLTCLDPATGERRWKAGRYGHGQLLLVGGLLFVQTEEGEGVLVEPTPEAHRELTRSTLLDGKTWNPPALSGLLLLVRNDREAALYEVPLQE